ncbi:hypothetical protein [Pediococcus pentosaceus]|jgi:hypothetical protein|uniref:hypothetical protein n=1 Tax=Pediococcus pentosaceus TaxID=1255 RepID=UPI0021E8EC57|nr:hypothetical protein [Pediococcus pentosaceus]MCV3330417.1 hypothetical protein [Pediococcus pentosaceus]
MTEFENVKDALQEAIEIVDAKEIRTKTGTDESHLATAEEKQSLIQERLYNIADLLGMSNLYLDDTDKQH